MLNQILDINEKFNDGTLTFILGLLVTFLGIAIIIFFVTIVGKFFNKRFKDDKQPKKVETANTVNIAPVSVVKNEEISPQVKAAIIAAISAYYFTNENKSTCDFIVKKIKRINRY